MIDYLERDFGFFYAYVLRKENICVENNFGCCNGYFLRNKELENYNQHYFKTLISQF